jgi:hypothetical protein
MGRDVRSRAEGAVSRELEKRHRAAGTAARMSNSRVKVTEQSIAPLSWNMYFADSCLLFDQRWKRADLTFYLAMRAIELMAFEGIGGLDTRCRWGKRAD